MKQVFDEMMQGTYQTYQPTLLFVSPFRRCIETAAIFMKGWNLDPQKVLMVVSPMWGENPYSLNNVGKLEELQRELQINTTLWLADKEGMQSIASDAYNRAQQYFNAETPIISEPSMFDIDFPKGHQQWLSNFNDPTKQNGLLCYDAMIDDCQSACGTQIS